LTVLSITIFKIRSQDSAECLGVVTLTPQVSGNA